MLGQEALLVAGRYDVEGALELLVGDVGVLLKEFYHARHDELAGVLKDPKQLGQRFLRGTAHAGVVRDGELHQVVDDLDVTLGEDVSALVQQSLLMLEDGPVQKDGADLPPMSDQFVVHAPSDLIVGVGPRVQLALLQPREGGDAVIDGGQAGETLGVVLAHVLQGRLHLRHGLEQRQSGVIAPEGQLDAAALLRGARGNEDLPVDPRGALDELVAVGHTIDAAGDWHRAPEGEGDPGPVDDAVDDVQPDLELVLGQSGVALGVGGESVNFVAEECVDEILGRGNLLVGGNVPLDLQVMDVTGFSPVLKLANYNQENTF